MSAWVRGNLLWKGRIFKKKSEIPQNDLTKPNIEGVASNIRKIGKSCKSSLTKPNMEGQVWRLDMTAQVAFFKTNRCYSSWQSFLADNSKLQLSAGEAFRFISRRLKSGHFTRLKSGHFTRLKSGHFTRPLTVRLCHRSFQWYHFSRLLF